MCVGEPCSLTGLATPCCAAEGGPSTPPDTKFVSLPGEVCPEVCATGVGCKAVNCEPGGNEPSPQEDPFEHEAGFPVLPVWSAPPPRHTAADRASGVLPPQERIGQRISDAWVSGNLAGNGQREKRVGDSVQHGNLLDCLVSSPTSTKRIVWEVLSAIAICYDTMTLPLSAFSFDQTDIAKSLGLATTIFWTADIVASFLCGYYRGDGCIEMRLPYIARRYLASWWSLLDVVPVGMDWVLVIVMQGKTDSQAVGTSGIIRALRTAKGTRAFRVLRLIRVFKLALIIDTISDYVIVQPLVTLMKIVKLLVGLAFIVHYIACGWYAVGARCLADLEPSWLSGLDEMGASMSYRYVVAYHWSLAQFTPAPNNYHPENVGERLYAILVLYVGLVLFSSLLGSTTALINRSKEQAYEQLRRDDLMRRFFTDNEVSMALWTRICLCLKEQRRRRQRVCLTELPLLEHLPKSLRIELQYEVYAPVVCRHPLLSAVDQNVVGVSIQVCHTALHERAYEKADEPFHAHMEATMAMFVADGRFEYHTGMVTSIMLVDHGSLEAAWQLEESSQKGQCIAEPVLWTTWTHRGLLIAARPSSAICSTADDLAAAVCADARSDGMFRDYALRFCEALLGHAATGKPVDDTFSLTDDQLKATHAGRAARLRRQSL